MTSRELFEQTATSVACLGREELTEQIKGQAVTDVQNKPDDDMLEGIGVPLNRARVKCGLLGLSGVRRALTEYTENHAGN